MRRGYGQGIEPHYGMRKCALDEVSRGGIRVAVADADSVRCPNLSQHQGRRIPGKGSVGFRRIGWDGEGFGGDALDRGFSQDQRSR